MISPRRSSISLLGWWSLICIFILAPSVASSAPPPRKRVVVIAGLPGSGKTTLTKSLSRVMGAPYYKCGDTVRGWIQEQGLPYTPETSRIASQHFAGQPGEIARRLSTRIQRSRKPVHIVDGVRSIADLKVLRERFDVRVVALQLPARLRHQRMIQRGRFANEDKAYHRARDRREIGLGVLHVLRAPFVRVDMSGPKSQVPHQARQLAQQLQKSW